jgi:hypothetical protein
MRFAPVLVGLLVVVAIFGMLGRQRGSLRSVGTIVAVIVAISLLGLILAAIRGRAF